MLKTCIKTDVIYIHSEIDENASQKIEVSFTFTFFEGFFSNFLEE